MSKTLIIISDVPDFGGLPSSKAVNVSLIRGSFSLSKTFCNINSVEILSPDLLIANEKCSFELSLYVLMPFFPTSAS
uniref:Uncharacterized protein n=1 Tax=Neolamprologus brichardi TaxID=32507 RepID=A0A3Q4GKN1_NEOBR